MEKRVAKAHVECNKQGWFSVHTEEEFPFGFFGEGCSAEEAMKDFLNVFEAMREEYFQNTRENIDAEFEFVYDASAFLQKYKGLLTLSGLSRMTGINKSQLSQYVCGRRHPSPKTGEKIKHSVKLFALELATAME